MTMRTLRQLSHPPKSLDISGDQLLSIVSHLQTHPPVLQFVELGRPGVGLQTLVCFACWLRDKFCPQGALVGMDSLPAVYLSPAMSVPPPELLPGTEAGHRSLSSGPHLPGASTFNLPSSCFVSSAWGAPAASWNCYLPDTFESSFHSFLLPG